MSSSNFGLVRMAQSVNRPAWPQLTHAPTAAPVDREAQNHPSAASEPSPAELLAKAQSEAAQMIGQAEQEADRLLQEARERGYREGRLQAEAAVQAEVEQVRQQTALEVDRARLEAEHIRQVAESEVRLRRAEAEAEANAVLLRAKDQAEALISEAREQQKAMLAEAEAALVELAVAAAVRLVQGHLAVQPAAVVSMVAAGLRRLKDSDCTVRVHPQDLPLLHAQRAALERELGAGALKLQADANVGHGGYTIHSPSGMIDGTLEAQSQQLTKALAVALGGK